MSFRESEYCIRAQFNDTHVVQDVLKNRIMKLENKKLQGLSEQDLIRLNYDKRLLDAVDVEWELIVMEQQVIRLMLRCQLATGLRFGVMEERLAGRLQDESGFFLINEFATLSDEELLKSIKKSNDKIIRLEREIRKELFRKDSRGDSGQEVEGVLLLIGERDALQERLNSCIFPDGSYEELILRADERTIEQSKSWRMAVNGLSWFDDWCAEVEPLNSKLAGLFPN